MEQLHIPEDFKQSIVRIYSAAGVFCGTGCLEVGGLIITCAHVIRDALGLDDVPTDAPGESVGIDFPFLGSDLSQDPAKRLRLAKVVRGGWGPSAGTSAPNDIAVLRLDLPPPIRHGCGFAPFDHWESRTPVLVHGFREGGASRGEMVTGIIIGNSLGPDGILTVDTKDSSYVVNPGFSGAPVFPQSQAYINYAVGMLIGEQRKDPKDKDSPLREDKTVADIIPGSRIAKIINEVNAKNTETEGAESNDEQVFPQFDGYPFRGLHDFDFRHNEIFFGRSAEIHALIPRLTGENSPRLLIIHGASGVGKSSLLKAGLLPNLIDEKGLGKSRYRKEITFEPKEGTDDPFLALASAIKFADDKRYGLFAETKRQLAQFIFALCTSGDSNDVIRKSLETSICSRLLREFPEDTQLVIAINQLEELLGVADELKAAFFRFMEIMTGSRRNTIICTLRSDALSEFLGGEFMTKVSGGASNPLFLLSAPRRDQLEEMILGPATVGKVNVERELVTQILDDAMAAPSGALPLVAYTLQTLQLNHRNNLTLDAYIALNGLTGAVEKLAAEAKAASDTGSEQLEVLFEYLVSMRHGMLSRCHALQSKLADRQISRSLIENLNHHRLLQTILVEGQPAVQLAHEILFQAWTDLRNWIEKSESKLKLRDEVELDASYWIENGRRRRFIKLRGEKLNEICDIVAADPGFFGDNLYVKEYLDVAQAQRQREKLIASVNGGHLSGLIEAFRAGGKLEIEDRHEKPGGVFPQFWAAVTGDDREVPRIERTTTDEPVGKQTSETSIFDNVKLIRSSVARGLSVLHLAAACGQMGLLQRLVAKDPSAVKLKSEGGSSILTAAAFGGNLSIVKFLVEECRLNPNEADDTGSTPIFWAHQQNHREIVAYLNQLGCTLDVSTDDGWNKMTEAARSGDIESVRTLLDQGENPDAATKLGYTPLMVACQSGHKSVARLLLDRGASPNKKTNNGLSALHFIAFQDDWTLFELFSGCDYDEIDNDGVPSLIYASNFGRVNHVEYLLTKKANYTLVTREGTSALFVAASAGYHRIVQMLLAAGDDINCSTPDGWTPLHVVCEDGDVTTARILLAHPRVDMNPREKAGWTPLMLAARKGHAEILQLMVKAGANRRLVNRLGQDALVLAIRARNLGALRALLANELALDRGYRSLWALTEHGHSASSIATTAASRATSISALPNYPGPDHLSIAVTEGDVEVVRILLAAGADPLRRDSAGDTALHDAARLGFDEIATLLLQAGALVDVRDSQERTPIDVASDNQQSSMIEILKSKGASEPLSWRQLRVSDQAPYLIFQTIPEQIEKWIRDQFLTQDSFILPPEQMLLRMAPLPFYSGGYIVAAEDPLRRGRREQFALFRPGEDFVMMNWTNEPIYSTNERWGISLSDDRAATIYCRFFFHFVRGQLGRFAIVEEVGAIDWKAEAPEEARSSIEEKVKSLCIINRFEDHIRLEATVVFKNALFRSGIILATKATQIIDEDGNAEEFTLGQLKFVDEELLLEELPIKIDGAPRAFG